MSNHYYPYPAPYQAQSAATHDVLQSVATGATVGAAAAAAMHLRKPTAERSNAVGDILKAGAVTGLATGAVSMVRQSLGCERKLFTFAAMFVTGAAVMYALNESHKNPSPTPLSNQGN